MNGLFIVREARLEDVPQISTINGDAFENDELWQWLLPDVKNYPFLNRNRLVRNARSDIVNPKLKIVVAETTGSEKMIVGFATWTWTLNKHEKLMYSETWSDWFNNSLLQLERRYIALFRLDKSVDDTRWKLMCEDINKADYWKDHSEYLMFWTLAVAPEYQRKGVGGLLTDACLQEAKEKKIGVGLLASPQGKGLYLRKGFKEIARATWGNPRLNGTAMIWTHEDSLI